MKTRTRDRIKGYAALALCISLCSLPQFAPKAHAWWTLHIYWVGPISVAWWWPT